MREWIDIDDTGIYPEKSGDYLVYMTGDGKYYFQDVIWFCLDVGFTEEYDVTHWMPLPEPPEIKP